MTHFNKNLLVSFKKCCTASKMSLFVCRERGRERERAISVEQSIQCYCTKTPGGTLIFSAYVGLDPASTVHPQKISGISSTPKQYLKFKQPPKISQLCTSTLKKTLKCIEMTLKLAQFCDDPKKISTKSSYPKKIFIFLKTPKNIEIQNFEPQKIARAYVCVKISEHPPPPPPPDKNVRRFAPKLSSGYCR